MWHAWPPARHTEEARLTGSGMDADAPAAGPARHPGDESLRLASVSRLAGQGHGLAALDRLAQLAARLLAAPSGQVSLVSDLQQVLGAAGAAVGAVGRATPSEDSLCTVTVGAGAPLVVHDALADDRVSSLEPVTSGEVGSYLGVPLASADGHTVGALCVFGPEPRTWSDEDVAMLEELAAPVVAELELEALTSEYESGLVFWQLGMEAAGIGAFDWNLTTGELRWDQRLLELFGLDEHSFGGTIEDFNSAIHPDDLARVTQVLNGAIETGGGYTMEYRVVLPPGEVRWISARGRALRDEQGRTVRLLGAAFDTTVAQEGEARVARVLEAMPTSFFQLDRSWRFTYVNAEAERLLGATRDALLGSVIWESFPAALGSDFETHYRQAMESREPVAFDAYYPPPLDAWYEVRGWPSPDGLSVYFVDVTDRHRAQEVLDRAARRSALNAAVTETLAQELDTAEAMKRLAPLLVPEVADWCVLTLARDDAPADWRLRLRDVGHAHADPALTDVVERYAELRLAALTEDSFLARAYRDGESIVVEDALEAISAVLSSTEALTLFRRLDPAAAAVLPLRGRGRTVGLLSAFRGRERPGFSAEDLETLSGVASRAGLALDNTRLYAEQKNLAEGLQRSLLTAPPEPDHLEIEVQYRPASHAAQVGGDWYDAFLQHHGATVVVVGDVVGHDAEAAAAMGQVRGLLRGIAVHSGEGPAEVLRGVDRVMQTLQVDTTATVVAARLEQSTEEREQGVTRLRWSNAGHPPPLVVNPDRTVVTLASGTAELLLGLDPDTERTETLVTLERGATVLLYTDGLVERRGESLDEGIGRLTGLLAELGAEERPLRELCDQLIQRMMPERPEDDVALVAVRLHPEEHPRPPEAGPNRVPDDVPNPASGAPTD
jgi:PAS domain S-box-containing protein